MLYHSCSEHFANKEAPSAKKDLLSRARGLFAGLSLLCGSLLASQVLASELGQEGYRLGQQNIGQAQIQYANPLSEVSMGTEQTRALVERLAETRALNQDEISRQLDLSTAERHGAGFAVANPYYPRYQGDTIALPKPRSIVVDGKTLINPEGYDDPREGYTENADGSLSFSQQAPVTRWFSDVSHGKAPAVEVCAVKFEASSQTDYRLRTFANQDAAQLEGWTVTHQYQCGSCSTLRDLAVYIGIPNQTAPISGCNRQSRGDKSKMKACVVAAVGFTEMCAESWAYNGVHTLQQCTKTCMAARKLGEPLVMNAATGKLNSCLWCDEKVSGPGFKYSAGRTRRGSGLESAIARPNDKLFYEADHSRYFSE